MYLTLQWLSRGDPRVLLAWQVPCPSVACFVRSWQQSFLFTVFRLVTNIVLLVSRMFFCVWTGMVRSLILGSSNLSVLFCWKSVEFIWRYGLQAFSVEFFWRYGLLSALLSSLRVDRDAWGGSLVELLWIYFFPLASFSFEVFEPKGLQPKHHTTLDSCKMDRKGCSLSIVALSLQLANTTSLPTPLPLSRQQAVETATSWEGVQPVTWGTCCAGLRASLHCKFPS